MKRFGKSLSTLAVLVGFGAAGWFAYETTLNVKFAHAKEQVELARDSLAKVEDLSAAFRSIGKVVEPAVVNIKATKKVKAASLPDIDPELLKRFFPKDENGQPQIPDNFGEGDNHDQTGTGSGVIMDTEGGTAFIITNNHVAGGAEKLIVTLADGRVIKNAKVVGVDPKSDLAVIKIEADRVIPAKWGDSDDLQKGDWILAFGSPFDFVGTMTHGIVSALNRSEVHLGGQMSYENFIQVDAPINPGNSGGPLVNLKGEVVGINTAIASRTGAFSGIGLAIPSNQAKSVYSALKQQGRVVRGWLGVGIVDVSNAVDDAASLGFKGTQGIIVTGIMPGTPAAGKLLPSDIIVALAGKPVENITKLRNTIADTKPGTDVAVKIFRDGKEQIVTIKIAEQPEDVAAVASNGRSIPRRRVPAPDEVVPDKMGATLATITDDLAAKYQLTDVKSGAIVTAISPKSLASRAGLKVGDVITKVDKQDIANAAEAREAIAKADVAKGVRLFVTDKEGTRFLFLKNGKE